MPMRFKDEIFMNIAKEMSKASYCERVKVGAIIVKDERIISTGYNGTPSGSSNLCEVAICGICDNKLDEDGYCSFCGECPPVWSLKTNENVIHAEMNAILFAAKNGVSINGSILYVTVSPCVHCAKNIIQSGIKEVIYEVEYRDVTGISILKDEGIIVRKYVKGDEYEF